MYTSERSPLLVGDKDPSSDIGYTGDLVGAYCTRDGRLLHYDARRAGSCFAVFRITGTVFAERVIWLWTLFYTMLAAATCVTLRLCLRRPYLIEPTQVGELVNYTSVFIGFLLSLHLTLSINRWLVMRRDVLGQLWSAVNDIAHILAVHLPEPENLALKNLTMRYGIVSFELLLASDSEHLYLLTSQGVLQADECAKLELAPCKSQLPWVWLATTFRNLAARGRLSSRLLARLYGACESGRGACDCAALCAKSPPPPSVVGKLLTWGTHGSCAMMAIKCGAMAAAAATGHITSPQTGMQQSRAEGVLVLIQQLAMAVCVPFWYCALLRLGDALSQPLTDEGLGALPVPVLRAFLRDECEAFYTAGEHAPKALRRAAWQISSGSPTVAASQILRGGRQNADLRTESEGQQLCAYDIASAV